MAERRFGVAFSGGGIRSAAFCSGVLRRLIRRGREPDFLSCVSGGGYTGSAYVEWKYRNQQKQDQASWKKEFFNHMRTHTSLYCNWQNCCEGCSDSIILSFLLLFVAIIVPVAGWGSFSFPIAFMVNFFYGQFLDGPRCRKDADDNDCIERTILFSVSIGLFAAFHFVEYFVNRCENKENYLKMKVPKVLLKIGQMISGGTFFFTFLPWFIDDFLRFTLVAIQIAIIAVTAVFWFFLPLLRKYSSLVILIYAYSFVVSWHVYKRILFTIVYTKERFEICMIVSLVILAVLSVLGNYPLRLIHIYNRWRLQKAFYYHNEKENKSCSVCYNYEEQCCYCYEIFTGGHCSSCCCTSCKCPPTPYLSETANTPGCFSKQNGDPQNRTLTLGDLKDIKPQYISNTVVNGWRRKYGQEYCVFAMSPKGISVIDEQPTSTAVKIEIGLIPSDIRLSSAMAMSAAAVSPHLGKYEVAEQGLAHFLAVCNLDMAANIVYDMKGERSEHCCGQLCFYVANLFLLAVISTGCVFGVMEMLKSSFPVSSVSVIQTSSIVGGILAILIIMMVLLCLKNWYSISLRCCRNTASNLVKLSR